MAMMSQAVGAYARSAALRDPREQEADVFRRVNAALRRARTPGATATDRVRALADNGLLWSTVIGLLADPDNAMAPELRGRLISLGRVVQAEMERDAPDFGFLIEINDNVAAGLEGRG